MLLPAPPLYPRRPKKGRKAKSSLTPPAATLVLTGAHCQLNDLPYSLTLQFDRPVDIAAYDGSQITVKDGQINGIELRGTGSAHLDDPTTVNIELVEVGPYDATEDELLTASATTGIVATDDGGTWDGVTDVELPYPA